jgi:hypothetical protein
MKISEKKRDLILTLVLLIAAPVFSFAGGISGGGGTGIYCKDSSPKNYLMLDTYEGSIRRQYTYSQMLGLSASDILQNVLEKLKVYHYHHQALVLLLTKVRNSLYILPEDVAISIPSDAQNGDIPLLYPRTCELLGIGFFESTGQLVMDRKASQQMDDLEKAAFYLHEAIFYSKRQWHSVVIDDIPINTARLAADSREVVSFLLADQSNSQNITAAGLGFAGFLGREYDLDSSPDFPLDKKNNRLHMNVDAGSNIQVYIDLNFSPEDRKNVLLETICSGYQILDCQQTSPNSVRINLRFEQTAEDSGNYRNILTGPHELLFKTVSQTLPPGQTLPDGSVNYFVSLQSSGSIFYLLDGQIVFQKKLEFAQAQYLPDQKIVRYNLNPPKIVPNFINVQVSP